jgi:hypothetical protein
LSLVAFIFVVQLPVRYLASRLRDPEHSNRSTPARLPFRADQ